MSLFREEECTFKCGDCSFEVTGQGILPVRVELERHMVMCHPGRIDPKVYHRLKSVA